MNEVSKVSGVFCGTGAALYLCVGFIPKKVLLRNLTTSGDGNNEYELRWTDGNTRGALAAGCDGWLYTNGAGAPLSVGSGVRPYEGGDLMTSTNQTDLTYGGGVFLGWDLKDYRANNSYGPASGVIDTWTQSSTNTGHWNTAIVGSGSRIGAGSRILIKEASSGLVKEAGVAALTSTGALTNQVTLSRTIGNGTITFLGGIWDMAPIALGKVAPAGIYLADTTLNIDAKTIYFEMEA